MKRLWTFMALLAGAGLLAGLAEADVNPNGANPNGLSPNGVSPNGIRSHGISSNGVPAKTRSQSIRLDLRTLSQQPLGKRTR